MTFSWTSENGPPFISEPILFAGIRKEYSSSATHQLINTMYIIDVFCDITFISCSLRFPYHASVMKQFETTKSASVRIVFVIVIYFYFIFLF